MNHNISPYIWPGIPASLMTNIDIAQIIEKVCAYYSVKPELLSEPIRWKHVVRARFVAWHLMKKLIRDVTLAEMGKMFRKDHTTVIHGLRSISNDLETDPTILRDVEKIIVQIRNSQ